MRANLQIIYLQLTDRLHQDGLDGGRTMGLTTAEMSAVVGSLPRRQFYKSMTSYADHRVWQDVYHAPTLVRRDACIKVTLRDGAPVIQFKDKARRSAAFDASQA